MKEAIIRGNKSSYKYQPKQLLDLGNYGYVHEADDIQNNQKVALKIQLINDFAAIDREKQILEILKRKRLLLKNIVQILDFFRLTNEDGEQFCTVMELAEENFTKFWRKKRASSDIGMKLSLFHQMSNGVNEIHLMGLCHRDIKPGNILCFLDKQKNVTLKICDIGSAKFDNTDQHTNNVGTLQYMAPEVLDKQYNKKVDIWSLGIILYELFQANPLFKIEGNQTKINYLAQDAINNEVDKIDTVNEIKNLMKQMVAIEPEYRLSSEQVIKISQKINEQHKVNINELYQTVMRKIQSEQSEYQFDSTNGEIGRGSYGIVYKGQEIKNKKEVAIKISSDFEIREKNILQTLKQKRQLQNIIVVFDVIEIDSLFSELIVVTEIALGNLSKYLEQNTLDQQQKIALAFQIINGLYQIHELGYLHRNLKPENILYFLDNQNQITLKICDIGKARTLEGLERTQNAETQDYMAPEVDLENHVYDQKVDVWSAGVIMFKIFSQKKMIFPKLNQDQIYDEIEKLKIEYRMKDLLKEMIQINPKNRVQSQEVFNRLRELWISQRCFVGEKIIYGNISFYKYAPDQKLVQGKTSNIYLAFDLMNNKQVVLKIKTLFSNDQIQKERNSLEIQMKKGASLQCVVRILDVFVSKNVKDGWKEICSVQEVGEGNFSQFWNVKKNFSDIYMQLSLSSQIIYAINEIHSANFRCINLKKGNILFFNDSKQNITLKICNIDEDNPQNKKADIFQAGLILFEIFTKQQLNNQQSVQLSQKDIDQKIDEVQAESIIKDLLKKVLVINGEALNSNQLLQFFKNVNISIKESYKLCQQGDEYYKNKQLQQASEFYNKAITLNINNDNYHFKKGICLRKLGKLQEAIQSFDLALRLNHKETKYYTKKGVSLNELNRFDEAIYCYDQAISQSPKKLFALYFKKGKILENQKKYQEAIECYNQAIKLNSEIAEYFNRKANALLFIGKPQESLDCYNQAILLSPQQSKLYRGKGNALSSLAQFQEGIFCFNEAIRIDPFDTGSLNGKGNSLYNLRRYKEAIECYDLVINLLPDDNVTYVNKGNALYNMNNFSESIKLFKLAIQKNPNVAQYYFLIGQSLDKLGYFDDALIEFDKAINLDRKNGNYLINKGNSLHNLKRYEEAIKCYDQAKLLLQPSDPSPYIYKGISLHNLNRFNEAISCYNLVIRFNPQNADALFNLGLSLAKLGNYEEAIVRYQEAIRLNPEKAEHKLFKDDLFQKVGEKSPGQKKETLISSGILSERKLFH